MTVKGIRLFLLFLFWTIFIAAKWTNAVVAIRAIPNGQISFEAQDSTLQEIVKELYDNYSIEVKGLDASGGKKVTFSYKADTPEELLKSLLRHIGIKNYAFEFSDATLKRLVVVPAAPSNISSVSKLTKDGNQKSEFVNIAQIQSIVEASQAESAGLQEGDIILEYDGVPITSAQQLVSEVEKKAATSQIDMVIVRKKIPTRLMLNGGFIGVRVMTKKIPRAEFNTFQ